MAATEEQRKAIEKEGKVIVTASAGSGKTFVMIQKLVKAIIGGVDINGVLAVTFTKKAAAQMKEKLRSALREAIVSADASQKQRLKIQLADIQSADISTIHSFCARLLRTYFYAVGIDGTFDIMASDSAEAKDYKSRVIDSMFERYYSEKNSNFLTLLSAYRRKRSDERLKAMLLKSYETLRINPDYVQILQKTAELYTDEGFKNLCGQIEKRNKDEYLRLADAVRKYYAHFKGNGEKYAAIFADIIQNIEKAAEADLFAPQAPLTTIRKPNDSGEDEKREGDKFRAFRDRVQKRYAAIRGDISDEETEKNVFLSSGEVAKAYAAVLEEFDREYNQLKLDENKLDYNDLEHLTLKLLSDENIRGEIRKKYECVFVDEYQDVNPVQESIISSIAGENSFFVGDAKQAIYGFRGSQSAFFMDKIGLYDKEEGSAFALSSNFRSSDGVLNFVNKLFSNMMTKDLCDFDYSKSGRMVRGGGYPEGYGSAGLFFFGKNQKEQEITEVYSVKNESKKKEYSRETLAVLEIVKHELGCMHYDLNSKSMVETKPSDICILIRKRSARADEIVRALTERGYSVAGEQDAELISRPEVKKVLDILSYIDNKQQDIPLATALLSPLGGLSLDELAAVRVAFKGRGKEPFRECCRLYIKTYNNQLAQKLRNFRKRVENLRDMAEVFSAERIIDKILEETYLEAKYCKGERLRNIRRLAQEGKNLSVSAFLDKINSRYKIKMPPSSSSSDCIKMMTMHASKGLEFPVVIITDICAEFTGRDKGDLLFDKDYGFAHKYYDEKNMLVKDTLLRKFIKANEAREDIKNELNLFYVACTRAMCNLYVLACEREEYNPAKAYEATSYSQLFDMSLFAGHDASPSYEKLEETSVEGGEDGEYYEEVYRQIKDRFQRKYWAESSVNLPVKSSASAILKMGEEQKDEEFQLFGGEGETGTQKGIAYHRFLELCDFEIRDREGIEREKQAFLKDNLISDEQAEILKSDELEDILAIPVFSTLKGATLLREQEFLCRLPARGILPTEADDDILVQGAIDLLANFGGKYVIIDYKYSHKNAEELKNTYYKQLALYKKAVAKIGHVDESEIKCIIVNIFLKEQINL